jgi:hypothetical protein
MSKYFSATSKARLRLCTGLSYTKKLNKIIQVCPGLEIEKIYSLFSDVILQPQINIKKPEY